MYGYIYKTTDKTNNKIYVGQKKSNIFLCKEYLGSGVIIKSLVEKYGVDRFEIELIDTAETKQELNEKEVYWISKLDARNPLIGYNIAEGGYEDTGYHLGMLGKHQSDKQKASLSEIAKRPWTDERKLNKSISMRGNNNGHGNKGVAKTKHWAQSESSKQHLKEIMPNVMKEWHKNLSKDKKQEIASKISKAKKGKIEITDGKRRIYIKPEEWPIYEKQGLFKMSLVKYNKYYSK